MSLICPGTTRMAPTVSRDAVSCPSSPTETESSSGFSTLRRRSVNVTEKVRQNRDGSKIQVVRESAVSTSSAKEPSQSVTFQQNSFVYINGSGEGGNLPTGSETFQNKSTDMFPQTYNTYSSMVPSSSISDTPSSQGMGAASLTSARPRLVRLNSLEPNTVMFSTKDYPLLVDVSVPEIIDELEQQFDAKLCEVQGVRLAGNKIFICLSQKDCLHYMAQYGFYVRGVHVTVMDISNDSVVICLIGVPHYITDSTITILVSTFGICIGEVERRFYKGVDTGERYLRVKPKASCQIPDYVTVGGCKILVRVLTQDEVGQPFILDSVTSRSEPVLTDNISLGSGNMVPSYHRSKPGHCNGSLNSPGSTEMPPPPPPLTLSSSCAMSTGLFSPQMNNKTGAESSSSLSLPSSPKIARSFRSRINVTLKSPTSQEAGSSSTYVPGESVDGFPALSPPSYRTPGPTDNGSAHGVGAEDLPNSGKMSSGPDDIPGSTGTIKRSNRESPSASSLRKYAIQNNNNSLTNNLQKGDSTQSINSMEKMGSVSDTLSREGNTGGNGKRASVVFEEPKGSSRGSNSLVLSQNRQVSTSKTVNGILRKGSLREEEEKRESVSSSRKSRKSVEARNKADRHSSKHRSHKSDSALASGEDTADSEKTRSSRSRSNSTKSNKTEKKENLALTRDLPWCGCWGNGCL